MNIRKYILFFTMIMFSATGTQNTQLIKWQIYEPDMVNLNSAVNISFKANIKPYYYIFSVNKKAVNHSKNTSIWFRQNDSFKVVESPESIFEIEYFNRKTSQMEYIIEEGGGFAQKIKILKPNLTIKGQINYVLCNKGSGQEIAQVYHFEIQLKTKEN